MQINLQLLHITWYIYIGTFNVEINYKKRKEKKKCLILGTKLCTRENSSGITHYFY